MSAFHIASACYLCGSLMLFGLMFLMGTAQRKAFAAKFGELARFEDLPDKEAAEWEQFHERRFNAGTWRLVALCYMVYHYPGLIVSALFRRDSLRPAVMFVASAVVWIGLLYLILRP